MLFRIARAICALAAAALTPAGPALACMICLEAPEQTFADRLLAAETLVLARPDPDDVFRFVAVESLRGEAQLAPIPHFADSATRQRLAGAPPDGVLFARLRSGAQGPLARRGSEWQRLAYADRPMRDFVAAILEGSDSWRTDRTGRNRFEFFAALHDHDHPAIREIAIGELARAPYAMLRDMKLRLSADDIVAALRDPTRVPWASTYILLLGRSGDTAARAMVRETVSAAAATTASQPNLAAWATALVEIEGAQGVERLAAGFLRDPSRNTETVKQVVMALAVHAREGDPALAATIAGDLRELALRNPGLAPLVATELGAIGDWSMAEHFSRLLQAGTKWQPDERFALAGYVAMSARGGAHVGR